MLGRWGTNLQNIEKSLRELYEADDGKLFCQVDQAGAEALIVAYLMPAGNALRELFKYNIKIHNYLGVAFPEQWQDQFPEVRVFKDVKISELKQFPGWSKFEKAVKDSDDNPPATRYYYHYKMTGHSANYNIHAPTFVGNLLLKSGGAVRLTRQQGERYLDGYHKLIPEIRNCFHRYVGNQYKTHGRLYNFQGFPITLTTHYHENEFSKIYDKIPQSTVGCITHIAFTKLQQFIESNHLDWDLLINGHDSYLAQAPEVEILECAKKMKEFMEQSLTNPWGETFQMRSEAQIGKNWAPRKEKILPDGSIKVINSEGLVEIKL